MLFWPHKESPFACFSPPLLIFCSVPPGFPLAVDVVSRQHLLCQPLFLYSPLTFFLLFGLPMVATTHIDLYSCSCRYVSNWFLPVITWLVVSRWLDVSHPAFLLIVYISCGGETPAESFSSELVCWCIYFRGETTLLSALYCGEILPSGGELVLLGSVTLERYRSTVSLNTPANAMKKGKRKTPLHVLTGYSINETGNPFNLAGY